MAQVHRCIHSVMNDSENPMLSLSFRVTAIYAVLPLRSRIGYRRGLMSRKIVTFNKYHRIDTDFRNAVVFDVSNSIVEINRICEGLDSNILSSVLLKYG